MCVVCVFVCASVCVYLCVCRIRVEPLLSIQDSVCVSCVCYGM